ncbi:MAG: bifunctional folylpolyglutamate synthase/dihydrofolate synthase [Bacteroidia bacterium]|nr:bifunctional folylpolyglutamate synthase/dihydrofolate synthase [Bacteroidia bacterium]
MNYQQTLDYLFSQLPMFTRIGAAAYKNNLTNTIALCKLLKYPQSQFESIHIAGTNGKGSTAHMLASVLQEAEFKVGLYTSPHLKDFRERIKINGQPIPEQFVVDFVEQYKADFDEIKPSFFEWTVALCFHYFALEKVDVAIIETGLGGRLDSTNVITPELSVITNIGWDHMDLLGDNLQKIAAEKAGIIKGGVPVVIGEYQPETWPVFEYAADVKESPIVLASETVELKNINQNNDFLAADIWYNDKPFLRQLKCDLTGDYQINNIKTAITAIVELKEIGFEIPYEAIMLGMGKVVENTGLMGRWQVLQQQPLLVVDTGHNVNGIEYVLAQIKNQTFDKLHFVIGMVSDKDISKVLSMLPQEATYYFTNANIPRAMPAAQLATEAAVYNLNGKVYATVNEAKQAALKQASITDMIFIGGSTFIVAEAL